MMLSDDERRRRLEMAAGRMGGKAALGRRLGFRDGAFVGQMIRGERPITEKTIVALGAIREVADLFSFSAMGGFKVAENDPAPYHRAAVTLAEALPVVLDALRDAPQRDELRRLLPLLVDTDAPAYRQRLAELLKAGPG